MNKIVIKKLEEKGKLLSALEYSCSYEQFIAKIEDETIEDDFILKRIDNFYKNGFDFNKDIKKVEMKALEDDILYMVKEEL